MWYILLGIFIILHGLVHLLYFGHSEKYFELRPGLTWPEDSWAFSKFFDNDIIRVFAGLFSLLSTIGFVLAGIITIEHHVWWKLSISYAAILSSLVFIFFWDGKPEKLSEKGGYGLFINIIILICFIAFRLPVTV